MRHAVSPKRAHLPPRPWAAHDPPARTPLIRPARRAPPNRMAIPAVRAARTPTTCSSRKRCRSTCSYTAIGQIRGCPQPTVRKRRGRRFYFWADEGLSQIDGQKATRTSLLRNTDRRPAQEARSEKAARTPLLLLGR